MQPRRGSRLGWARVICFWDFGDWWFEHGVSRVLSNEPSLLDGRQVLSANTSNLAPPRIQSSDTYVSTIDALVSLNPPGRRSADSPSNRQSWRHSPAHLLNNTHLSLRALPTIGVGGGARWGVWGEESDVLNF